MIDASDYSLPSAELNVDLLDKDTILEDYRIVCLSRELSIVARREVLNGRAKFATTDDGKELLQVAMAKAFRKGDFRAGYYRGHTLMLALGLASVEDLLAQLYADIKKDPFSGGRQMFNHHATPLVDEAGKWTDHRHSRNISSDISPTAGQVARALGLAFASTRFRAMESLDNSSFSDHGNEVCFCNIGDGSTSEGAFWEAMNAAGVLQVPLAVSVWDDGFGISVPNAIQTVKSSISKAMKGLQQEGDSTGIDIYIVKGWDYPALCETYVKGIDRMRQTHTPALIHIYELTQPQGHSTSGSHERYKTKDRLNWEAEHDCNFQFRSWILENGIAEPIELEIIENRAVEQVQKAKSRAWKDVSLPVKAEMRLLKEHLLVLKRISTQQKTLEKALVDLEHLHVPVRSELIQIARRVLFRLRKEKSDPRDSLEAWVRGISGEMKEAYNTCLYCEGERSALNVPVISPRYEPDAPLLNGFRIINTFFDRAFEKHPNLFAFGEDVGLIGDVNQGFAGLQEKYGEERIFDTGIREWSIMGQAIGMAMRGLRPIAEIQYLDYLLYALAPLSDDLATLRYRTNGMQVAPAIIRTRGHRLEGVWHSGSSLGLILHSLRGMYVLVPRNFTQAAGMYNTLLQSDDPALLIECLNAYRLKERLPANIGEYTVPLGIPEVLEKGEDLTIVTYGACVRIAQQAIQLLKEDGVSVDLIDVQTLIPFDLEGKILQSLQKTNRILFLDEDVPGGASAYMMREVLEVQNGYRYLDSGPRTLTAQAHRPPYGSDGDYFSKPNPEDVYELAFSMLAEAEPERFN